MGSGAAGTRTVPIWDPCTCREGVETLGQQEVSRSPSMAKKTQCTWLKVTPIQVACPMESRGSLRGQFSSYGQKEMGSCWPEVEEWTPSQLCRSWMRPATASPQGPQKQHSSQTSGQ